MEFLLIVCAIKHILSGDLIMALIYIAAIIAIGLLILLYLAFTQVL